MHTHFPTASFLCDENITMLNGRVEKHNSSLNDGAEIIWLRLFLIILVIAM